jgi:hypothetical protein
MSGLIYNKLYMRKWRKEHPTLARKRIRDYFRKNPLRHAYQRHVSEMRYVIRELGGEPAKLASLSELYKSLVCIVKRKPNYAKKKFSYGVPDAIKHKVEFKIGLDRLHTSQFVWNILNGHNCKVRWFPSYDALEDHLRGRKSKGKVFRSYREFILWKYGQ